MAQEKIRRKFCVTNRKKIQLIVGTLFWCFLAYIYAAKCTSIDNKRGESIINYAIINYAIGLSTKEGCTKNTLIESTCPILHKI